MQSRPFGIAMWLFGGALACAAAAIVLRSRTEVASAAISTAPVVVELFTSEGCSSCPPADDLLRRLANSISADGQPIIALSEHVTYWNSLGWTDPFSQEQFTARQNRYSSQLRLDEVYTPQAVVNGRAQFVGSNRAALEHALHSEAQRPALRLEISGVHRSGDRLEMQVRIGESPDRTGVELWSAITDDSDSSDVARGENGGRTLRHAAVVRSLVKAGKADHPGEQTLRVTLPAAVLQSGGKPHHIALLAQTAGQGTIVGAASAAF